MIRYVVYFSVIFALSYNTVSCCTGLFAADNIRKSVRVTVDPRIELLSVVQYLSDYTGFNGNPVLTNHEFPYKSAAIEYFTPYKEHEAVSLFDEMSANGFWYGQPPEAMLSLTDPPELEKVRPIDSFVIERAGGKDKLDSFIEALRAFARDTDFMAFFHSHEQDYLEMVEGYRQNIAGWSYVDDLSEFYGYSQNSYTVVLAPFFHPGGFGPRIAAGDDIFDVYNLCGPWNVNDGSLYFGDNDNFRGLVWHEFSHSYVNHLTDRYIGLLTSLTDVLQPGMKEIIAGIPNATWELFVHEWVSEHIVRSVTIHLAYVKLGDKAGDEALARETKKGYPYVKQLCDRLETYRDNRTQYATFPDFFPELVRVFEEEVAKKEK